MSQFFNSCPKPKRNLAKQPNRYIINETNIFTPDQSGMPEGT